MTISRTRRLVEEAMHQAVFGWVLRELARSGLLKGKTVGIDATTLEANAAMKSIVRRDTGESYTEYLRRRFWRHIPRSLHFTPTYSSGLNQVELWFSKLQRDLIARGIFPSTADLARKLRRYINAYSKDAQPFQWKYSNPVNRIRHASTSSATVH